MNGPLYIAVDLGAGSGRVFLAGVDPDEFLLEEIHRFHYPPARAFGHLRWNFEQIFSDIKVGLSAAAERAKDLGRAVHSLGVDSWAVDYGLVDGSGILIADPFCYRDDRTRGVMERVFEKVPRKLIFETTGIQFQPFNTLYQLVAEGDTGRAEKLLLLPDLINYLLTGRTAAEYTNATTTQMVDAATGDWAEDLIAAAGLEGRLLQPIIRAGTEVAELLPVIASELGLEGVRVIAPATHDTASAIAGAPLSAGSAYISSGTWSLIGVERGGPLINDEAARQNFTNEGGAYGTFRFLKNVMGLWILESCRREWQAAGTDAGYDELLAQIDGQPEFTAFIFPDDPRFLAPASMLEAIGSQLAEAAQAMPETPGGVAKLVFDSLAFRYASVLRSIESLTGEKLDRILVLGGGGKNKYLNQMTANASGLPVYSGLTEATVVGNVLVQAIASGRFVSLNEARQHVRENFSFDETLPETGIDTRAVSERYEAVELRIAGYEH